MFSLRDQPENAYESIDQAEAANLLGVPNSNSVRLVNEQPEYAMVNKKDKRKVKVRWFISLLSSIASIV